MKWTPLLCSAGVLFAEAPPLHVVEQNTTRRGLFCSAWDCFAEGFVLLRLGGEAKPRQRVRGASPLTNL